MTKFQFHHYQKDDIARLAMHEGGILGWEPGLGKTIAMFTWPQLKAAFATDETDAAQEPRMTRMHTDATQGAEYPCKSVSSVVKKSVALRCLVVAPEGLHAQITREAKEKFGIALRPLKTQADAIRDAELNRAICDTMQGRESTVTGWWLTSYSQLGFNGGDEWAEEWDEHTGESLLTPKLLKQRAAEGTVEKFAEHIGHRLQFPHGKIKCVNHPTLATLLTAFGDVFNAVVCDEAVRLKSDDSYTSVGVRMLNPKWRLVLTGTPIKNHLDDLFWLAQWATGGHAEPTGRWPYASTTQARENFANAHMVIEENHTRAEAAAATGRRRKFKKRIPQLTNIHRLWKLLGPVVIRRRKQDIGSSLMPKTITPIRVKPGTSQLNVYHWHCQNPPEYTKAGTEMNKIARVVAQLTNLRIAALSPDSKLLQGQRSWTPFSPKLAACLALIEQQIMRGERMVVMSPFQEFGTTLHRLLTEAGVGSILLDGDTNPARRGKLAQDFKDGAYAVLIGGIQSMGEGHSFECASSLILPSLDWAFDKNAQAEDRVHRLTSKKPVTIYTLVTEGTVDERLASVYREKSDASGLALDGGLIEGEQGEVNLGELLRDAVARFDENAETLDEQDLEDDWNSGGRTRLGAAMLRFREFHPLIVADKTGAKVTPDEVKKAVVAYTGTVDERKAKAWAMINRLAADIKKGGK